MIEKINLSLPVKSLTGSAVNGTGDTGEQNFSAVFKNALQEVNKLQFEADAASQKLVTGKVDDIAPVVIAAEKASIALQLTVQVRNKIIDAYNEVMRMQV
ncbi:MAG TPA: flagellar hook-basal body complex protein FliE [Negativicutes bacterium]|nr:flagellar hook-basal body complex protein FliE [Negativicutes bacterium]